jgi:hypothetical protein
MARGTGVLLVALIFIVTLGARESSSAPIPKASTHGSIGSRFEASFPYPPSEQTFRNNGKIIAQYGVGILSTKVFIGRGKGTPSVDVSVSSLTNIVPSKRERPFLRSYLPTNHGGRIVHWHGLLAATEFVPGCDPSGQCVGAIGELVVLDGTTLYYVFTHQMDLGTAEAEIKSFRLID